MAPGAHLGGRGLIIYTDREAQRAIRERNKAQMEHYERRICELENQDSFKELEAERKKRQVVENELANIKGRLHGVVSMLHSLIGNTQG